MRARRARRGAWTLSGLESVVARIGAIERMVSGARLPVVAPGASDGTSFAAAFAEANATAAGVASATMTAATLSEGRATGATMPGATLAGATMTGATVIRPQIASATAPAGRAPRAIDPSYRPAHVTETDERVWNDCTWASAAMWIDKLSGGAIKVDREALRAASGDKTGGSSLGDVVRGARKLLGLDLSTAHDERLTVDGLLDRLAAGGGAIVQGSYASLPSNLTRHDPGFAARGVADSGHAVYVGPLDRATGKVWWDDPLARAGGHGQWIAVKDLRKFLWTDGHGRVSALATPADPAAAAAILGGRGTHPGDVSDAADAASISTAAGSAGVDPLLLAAYLDVTGTPSGTQAIDAGARDLAAAMGRYGRADLALESLGAVQAGSTRLAAGAVFAGDVLSRWADLLGRRAGG